VERKDLRHGARPRRVVQGRQPQAWNKNLESRSDRSTTSTSMSAVLLAKGYAVVNTTTVRRPRTAAEITGDARRWDDGRLHCVQRHGADTSSISRTSRERRLSIVWALRPASTFTATQRGARIGADLNYAAGLNVGRDGKRFFDGLLNDDPAAARGTPGRHEGRPRRAVRD